MNEVMVYIEHVTFSDGAGKVLILNTGDEDILYVRLGAAHRAECSIQQYR